jgi:hypothetical protein
MSVTTADIEAVLGRSTPPTSAEETQWDIWISDARMLIEARLGDLAELDQVRLDYVVREAVVAHIRRPDDATTVDVSVDDARASRTYRTSAGRVTIRDEWWDLLSPSSTSGAAFSIFPSSACNLHLPWCSSMFGANYCSCGVDIAGEPIFELG